MIENRLIFDLGYTKKQEMMGKYFVITSFASWFKQYSWIIYFLPKPDVFSSQDGSHVIAGFAFDLAGVRGVLLMVLKFNHH